MHENKRVGAIAVGRPTFDISLAEQEVRRAFDQLAVQVPALVGSPTIITEPNEVEELIGAADRVEVAVLIQATFTDSRFAKAVGAWADRVVVWSFPEEPTGERLRLNSLCGAILAANQLAIDGVPASFIHRAPGSAMTEELVAALSSSPSDRPEPIVAPATIIGGESLEAQRVAELLAESRIGVVGEGPDGFGPCEVVRSFGALAMRSDQEPIQSLFGAAGRVGTAELSRARATVGSRLAGLDQMSEDEIEPSLRLYGALEKMVADRGWSAVATRCWPECFTEHGGAICSPLGMLADDGVPGACEADMLGAATMLALAELAGSPSVLLDLVAVDTDADTAVLWHCGVGAPSTADPSRPAVAGRHPNREMALTHEFGLRPGRVTLARLSNSRGVDRVVYGTGEVLAAEPAFRGTSATVRFDRHAADVLATVFEEGLDHHLALVYGDLSDELEALAAELEVGVVRL